MKLPAPPRAVLLVVCLYTSLSKYDDKNGPTSPRPTEVQRLDRPTKPVTPVAPQKSDFHTEGVGCGCGEGLHPYIYMYKKTKKQYKDICGSWSKFFLPGMAILSQKEYFSQTFAMSAKNFRGPYVGLYVGIFGRKHGLDRGHLSVWATIKLILWRLHIHMWRFAFHAGHLLPLSKHSPNFREKSPYINFIFKNPCMFQSYLSTFAKLLPKKKYFSKFRF